MRLAALIPSTNVVVEDDFRRFAPRGVSVHAARAYLVETTAGAERRMLEQFVEQAARDLGTIRPDVVVFSCTSAGAILGDAGERALIERLSGLTGAPVASTNAAVHEALTAVGAERVAVYAPYTASLTRAVAARIEAVGIEVVTAASMGIVDPFAISLLEREEILAFVDANQPQQPVDALFLSCANLRAYALRDELERRTGVPVVTSNHAALQRALRLASSAAG
jgi:maleate isomerase